MIFGLLIPMTSIMRMIRRKKYIIIFALSLVFLLAGITYTNRGHFYTVDVYKSGQGWGYDVLVNKNVYIHQPYIPVINGQMPFPDKNSAKKTGRLVANKLRSHKAPALTKEELTGIIHIKGI